MKNDTENIQKENRFDTMSKPSDITRLPKGVLIQYELSITPFDILIFIKC